MKKAKKIIAIFVLLFFVVQSTAIITAKKEADDIPGIMPVENENIDLPVMTEIPEKSEFGLSLINPDPEPTMSFEDLPSQFSWRNYGGNWMTSVKDQQCGDCWDFSALGAFEAAINLASGYPDLNIDLSEQYVLSCLSAAGSCNGGWMSETIAYIKSTDPGNTGNGINGCPIESCMPYQGVDYIPCSDKCDNWDQFSVPPEEEDILWQVKDYGVTTISEDDPNGWNLLKSWVFQHGPITVDIYTGGWGSYWSSHHDPNDVYEQDDSGVTNHGVVICGWVDDPDILNGGYWIIKNSWGTSWGYGGYGNIAYGCNSVGTRDVTWVEAIDWPEGEGGGGPIDVDIAVFSDFDYETNDGTKYPHPGDQIEFTDISDGDVALREWDFNGDGIIDSTKRNPTWVYPNNGEYEVTLTVHSDWGLESDRTKKINVKEIWEPIAEIPSQVTGNGMTYSFDGRYSYDPDGGTITDYLWNFGDGATSDEKYTTHTFSKPDKIYEVTLTVTDSDGAEGSKTCKVMIDQTVPPVTEIHHGIGAYNSEWYANTQRIYFSATDWKEVIDTFYRVDGGSWQRYDPESTEFITIGTEGEHTVECYSVDYYLNQETPVSETFSIDKTEPTIDVTVTGSEQQNGWYTSTATIEINGQDELSGLSRILYQIDFGTWQEYVGPIDIGEGIHNINALALDKAGNSITKSTEVKVDTSAPESRVIFEGEGKDNRFYKDVEIKLVGYDKGSGVKETYYKIDDQPQGFNKYIQPITIDTIGEHTIEYYSIDNIGNTGETQTETFTISNLNFDLTITEPENRLYLFGIRLIPTQKPIIIGSGTITATITPYTQQEPNIDHIDIQIDGNTKKTLTKSPYKWDIDEQIIGTHTITITAYTNQNQTTTQQNIQATFLIF